LQLRLIATSDGNEAAFIRHHGAGTWLPLVPAPRKQLRQADSGRREVDTAWLEVAQDRVIGRYALRVLGDEVMSFDHVDLATGRRTAFEPAPTPRGIDPSEGR